MLLRLFSGSKFPNGLLTFFFGFLLWLPVFFVNEPADFPTGGEGMPLYQILLNLIGNKLLLSKIISLLFLFLQALILIRLNFTFILINKKTILPAFFFLFFVSFYYPSLKFNPGLFGSLALLLLINTLFSSYKDERDTWLFFNGGLILGTGVLFYAPLIYFLPFIWIAQVILRPFYWREWITPVVGIILPPAVYMAIKFLSGSEDIELVRLFLSNLNEFNESVVFQINYIILIVYILILVIIASGYMLKIYQFRKIYVRNYFLLFFWLFILSAAVFVFFTRFNPGMIYVMSIPVSFLLSNYFLNGKAVRMNNLFFIILILLALANGLNFWVGWI